MSHEGADPPLGCYGIIGNGRTAALVSDRGSIDWLCLPRFDSPSIFGAVLDRERGGRFQVCPAGPFASRRRYLPDTNILETTFTAGAGTLRLLDLMPVMSEQDKRTHLVPDHHILRLLECTAGEVEVTLVCAPRPGYGRRYPRLHQEGTLGVFYEHASHVLALQSDIPLDLAPDGSVHSRCPLSAGDRHWISLSHCDGVPAILVAPGSANEMLDRTRAWWQGWIGGCRYEGPWRDAVRRSALVLKLLNYAPSGAVVAAPTTSLPEDPGGVRNWDYRYCWLRDASLTVRAMLSLGFADEGAAFLSWLLHATRLTWPELQVLYDVYGRTDLRERTLPWLDGYAGSRPVRVGNASHAQLQLDVYGEVVDAAFRFVSQGGMLDRRTARVLVGLGETVRRSWRRPDEGIWEPRTVPCRHTFSSVLCWVALDRLVRLHEDGHLRGPVAGWRHTRDLLRQTIERYGYNERLGSYTSVLGGDQVDASLLQLANFEYLDPTAPRLRGTLHRVRADLGTGPGLLYRYPPGTDGLPGGEGAFGICCFWSAEARARTGDLDGAADDFEALLGYANDLGLFGEEIDPRSGMVLGNFPQGFTHIGLVNAAITIAHARGQHVAPLIPGHAHAAHRQV